MKCYVLGVEIDIDKDIEFVSEEAKQEFIKMLKEMETEEVGKEQKVKCFVCGKTNANTKHTRNCYRKWLKEQLEEQGKK